MVYEPHSAFGCLHASPVDVKRGSLQRPQRQDILLWLGIKQANTRNVIMLLVLGEFPAWAESMSSLQQNCPKKEQEG